MISPKNRLNIKVLKQILKARRKYTQIHVRVYPKLCKIVNFLKITYISRTHFKQAFILSKTFMNHALHATENSIRKIFTEETHFILQLMLYTAIGVKSLNGLL